MAQAKVVPTAPFSGLSSPADCSMPMRLELFGDTFVSPDRLFQLQIFMIGFVDDSNACVNDFLNPDQSPDVLLERATADAQLWNDLLCCSGGALEIPKCGYHLAHYGLSASGGPVLRTLHQSQTAVRIQERTKITPTYLLTLPAKRWDATNHSQTILKRV
jgi:hypothetical protein